MVYAILELGVNAQLVQNIKLAEVATGIGTENVRAPGLPLQAKERTRIIIVIDTAMQFRPTLTDYKNL